MPSMVNFSSTRPLLFTFCCYRPDREKGGEDTVDEHGHASMFASWCLYPPVKFCSTAP